MPILDHGTSARLCRKLNPIFYYSTMALPKEKRRAVLDVAAFLFESAKMMRQRYEMGGHEVQQEVLDLSRVLDRLYMEDFSERNNWVGLGETVRQYDIPKSLLVEYLDGLNLDFIRHGHRDWTQLQQHCHKRAGAPALMMARIVGINGAETRSQVLSMSICWELTRIICEVRQDLLRGKIYLPQAELAEHGVSEEHLSAHESSPPFQRLIAAQCERLMAHFAATEPALDLLPKDGSQRWVGGWFRCRQVQANRICQNHELILKNPDALALTWSEKLKIFMKA